MRSVPIVETIPSERPDGHHALHTEPKSLPTLEAKWRLKDVLLSILLLVSIIVES